MGSPRDRFSATVSIELGEDRRDMVAISVLAAERGRMALAPA
jgi:hypothetical protein